MTSRYLRYVIPLEIPAQEALDPPRRSSQPRSSEPVRAAVSTPTIEVAASGAVDRNASAAASKPRSPAPDPNRVAELELRIKQLEEQARQLSQAASSGEVPLALIRKELASVESRMEGLEERAHAAGQGVRLPIGTALMVPLVGIGLNAAFHFALYELFLHAGDAGGSWTNLAAETLLGFQIATESSPHVYFYWMAVEAVWTSLVIVIAVGLVVRRLRRVRARE